jgi:hypothetical protein
MLNVASPSVFLDHTCPLSSGTMELNGGGNSVLPLWWISKELIINSIHYLRGSCGFLRLIILL